ncbi:HupU protein [Accumulibacter sp.]|uniref:NADH-quinone oxidoreductase subunit B family protein n=1 Tax=Accumulibacter sp. TaxID=2053492 RepID=UPI0025D4E801|nr:HupU protein [Accumulibacter sp.]MCM8596918.1 HupU protein [Accumulibacter sp.]MCM8624416.1 HupU protein [Accumulibacter sp.]MDS4051066.1 HupU protein [Accumulibacter sp.]
MKLLWLQAAGCGGCTQSLLGAEARDGVLAQFAENGLEFMLHPGLSEATGDEALCILEAAATGTLPFDVLCVEGALLRGPEGSGRFQILSGTGRPVIEWVRELARRAPVVVAIGTCSAFGGLVAAGDNPAEACGLQFDGDQPGGLLGPDFRSGSGMPVINVAGCPTHPGWIVDTLIALALGALGPADLDAWQRPRFYTEQLVHHGCPRNEFYEFKASALRPSDLGCLMENLGCKGTQASADCNLRLWHGVGSCVRGGFPCIACTEPDFDEPGHPFLETPKIAGIPTGLPVDMPKAWFVALAALAKSAMPERVRENAHSDHPLIAPQPRKRGRK